MVADLLGEGCAYYVGNADAISKDTMISDANTLAGTKLTASSVTVAECTHSYGDPTFTWADDYSTCTAVFTCDNDAEHVEKIECKVVPEDLHGRRQDRLHGDRDV